MATSSIRAIQESIATLLAGDSSLMSLVSDVVNDVPSPSGPTALEYPYVFISHATEIPDHTFGGPTVGTGWRVVIRTNIYSRYQGDKEALQILERVVTLLNFQDLTVTGYTSAFCEYIAGRVLVVDKEKIETRHIPAEFRVTVHQ